MMPKGRDRRRSKQQPDENLGDVIDEFAERVAELDELNLDEYQAKDILWSALGEADDKTAKSAGGGRPSHLKILNDERRKAARAEQSDRGGPSYTDAPRDPR